MGCESIKIGVFMYKKPKKQNDNIKNDFGVWIMSEQSKNSADFVSELYRGAKMGVESIDTMLDKTDGNMKSELVRELGEYNKFEQKTLDYMSRNKIVPKNDGKLKDMMAKIGVQMNTAIDSTPSHIAEILIQGNSMGIIGITKTRNKHENASGELCSLADELIQMQQNNIDKLKQYL